MNFRLSIRDLNDESVRELALSPGEFLVGRTDACEIQLESPSVSRQHARLNVSSDVIVVEDLGSSNGVLVDGARITQPVPVGDGGRFVIGDYVVTLEAMNVLDPALDDTAAMEMPVLESRGGQLFVVRLNEDSVGEDYELGQFPLHIGRTDDNHVRIDHASVSRQHAVIVWTPDGWNVRDMGSSNGSFLNGVPVEGDAPIRRGDVVRFGDVNFVVTENPTNVDPGATRVVRRNMTPAPMEPSTLTSVPTASGLPPALIVAVIFVVAAMIGSVFYLVVVKSDDGEDATGTEEPDSEELENEGGVGADVSAPEVGTTLASVEAAVSDKDWEEARRLLNELDPGVLASDEAEALSVRIEAEFAAATLIDDCGDFVTASNTLSESHELGASAEAVEQALQCYESIDENTEVFPAARRELDTTIYPLAVERHFAAATDLAAGYDYDAAVEHLRRGNTLHRESVGGMLPPTEQAEMSRILLLAGDDSFTQGHFAATIERYRLAEELAPLDRERRARLATSLRLLSEAGGQP